MSHVRRAGAAALALTVGLLLGACSEDPNSVENQAKAGDRKGYLSGDGAVETIPAAKRKAPVELAGTTLDGKAWSTADAHGKVVVLNVWASWCGPCQTEGPELEKVWQEVSKARQPVVFMGINKNDNPDSGRATAKKLGITFPSLDDQSGLTILQLQGKASATPSTLVLDREGRIASRVSGEVTASTLRAMVEDAVAEQS